MKKALLLIKNWYKSITEPFELIKDNFGSIVAYEVLFRVLAFLVLLPIIAWAEKLWLLGNKTSDTCALGLIYVSPDSTSDKNRKYLPFWA